ncbi:MAG: aldehyde ferredoxin oxidoreductase family protein [Nitrososphaerales archaeon]
MLSSQILYVDLTAGSSDVVEKPDLFKKYLGGAGVASKLLLEEAPSKIDPFSPDAPIIIASSPFTAVFPCIVKAVAMFKSPLTGNLGESHAAGYFPTALSLAGYSALVIKGASADPVILEVDGKDVKIRKASSLWGLTPLQVEEALGSFGHGGLHSVISCGVAGENYVYYSNVLVDRYHHFGRLGLGAIFGSKKLKAVSVTGSEGKTLANPLRIKDFYEKAYNDIVGTDIMVKYHDYGTPANVLMLNEMGALPTENFRKTRFEDAEKISGEAIAESRLERKISCASCPIACVHLADIKEQFSPEHERGRPEVFKESKLTPYNYEPMYALGSNLRVSDYDGLLRLISLCEDLGLDAMTAGNVLGWATEAFEKKMITKKDTHGLKPVWGDVETYAAMLRNIAGVTTPFYVTLARGVDAAAEKYGGRDFALSLGGNGPAGYMTGYGSIAGTVVGARHSHLSNAGYSYDQNNIGKKFNADELADYLIEREDWLYIMYSLGVCYFARKAYDKETVSKMLAAIGLDHTSESLVALGREITHNLLRYKVQEGFKIDSVKIPKRLLEPETPWGRLDEDKIRQIISAYIKKREKEGVRLKTEDAALKDLLTAD